MADEFIGSIGWLADMLGKAWEPKPQKDVPVPVVASPTTAAAPPEVATAITPATRGASKRAGGRRI